jgi:uncharacterized membrane protein YdfJ with MMPL/SSD domain
MGEQSATNETEQKDNCLVRISKRFSHLIEALFVKWGRFVVRWPSIVIVIAVILAGAFMPGFA